jgi:phosphoribosyl 1,2-cyclic phosphodiesterase
MKACVLSSGSKGNATYIETNNYKILVDAGRNAKYLAECLETIGVNPSEIDYVLISHEHKDHVSALPVFVKKYKPTLLLNQKLFKELDDIKDYDKIVIYEDEIILGNLKISCIKSSHDAIDSRNFVFEEDGKSIVYVTDTGYVNQKNFKILNNRNVYLFESNHDIEMLMNGPYPKFLKQRVVGSSGHLSNKASSFYLSKLVGPNTQKIILMHLSETNNTEEKALESITNTFKEYEIPFNDICCAKQNEISEVIII